MPVTLYTKTTCAPCRGLKAWLARKGIAYTEVCADNDPTVYDKVVQLSGYQQFPCIVIGETVVSGANIGLISKLLML